MARETPIAGTVTAYLTNGEGSELTTQKNTASPHRALSARKIKQCKRSSQYTKLCSRVRKLRQHHDMMVSGLKNAFTIMLSYYCILTHTVRVFTRFVLSSFGIEMERLRQYLCGARSDDYLLPVKSRVRHVTCPFRGQWSVTPTLTSQVSR